MNEQERMEVVEVLRISLAQNECMLYIIKKVRLGSDPKWMVDGVCGLGALKDHQEEELAREEKEECVWLCTIGAD